MIKEEFIQIIGHSRNKKYYSDLGYDISVGETVYVRPEHLSKGSTFKITSICENCLKETLNYFKDYWNYTKEFKEPYYCSKCNVIKSEITSIEKWGVKNPMQNEFIKNKLKSSVMDKYGVSYYSKTKEWLEKFKRTSIERYGKDNPSKNQNIKDIIREKNEDFIKSEEFREISKEKKQRNTYKKYEKRLPIEYSVVKYNNSVFTINHSCGFEFNITKGLLYNRLNDNKIICTICNPIDIKSSSFEIEIGYFLKDMDIIFESRNRKILSGLELDYYIPSKNLAIECNGVYWHNELFKSNDYHINKTKSCIDKNIKLLHIWEDDWINKKSIIKSIIRNKIGLNSNRIWARKCNIQEVNTDEYKRFLESNHVQGYASSSYNIGLYYENELVSLMTFGWRRTNNKREFELIRFCNKIDINVVGAASKLFKYFLHRNVDIHEIISYSDISLFDGLLYKKLGFEKISLSKPNYFWVVDGVRRHRYNYSKRKLVKRGYDINKTEVEIMNDCGYWRTFSTGQEKFKFIR
jgi:hypothetical protein